MHRQNGDFTKVAKYADIVRQVSYWNGALNQAVLSKDGHNRVVVAHNLRGAIINYKEKVPEDFRKLIQLDLKKLEALCESSERTAPPTSSFPYGGG